MAKYRITGPDGHAYEVTAPDNATEEQVLAYAQQNYKPQQRAATPDLPSLAGNPTEGMGRGQKLAAGFAKSFVDTGAGLKQAATDSAQRHAGLLSGGLDAIGMDSAAGAIARHVGVPLARSQQAQQAEIDETRRMDAPLMSTGAGLTGNIVGQVTQIAAPVPGSASLRVAQGTSKLGRLVHSGATAGAYGATQPVAAGESRAGNAATSAALGGIGHGLAAGSRAVATRATNALAEPIRDSIELAKRAGIPLNLSQVTESAPLKAAQAVTRWLPFSGAGAALRKQQGAFNAAVGRSFGTDSKLLTDDVMRAARQKLSDGYEQIFGRNTISVSPAHLRTMAAIENEAAQNMTEAEARVVSNQVDKILRELSHGGDIGGKKYQALREQLREATDGGKIGQYVKKLRTALDDAANQSVGPDDAARLRKLNGQWANMRTAEDALKQVAGSAGNIRPAALWPLIRGGSTQEMRELAKIGQNVLKEGVGDSGTAQRQFWTNLMTGSGAASTGAALGMLPAVAQTMAAGAIAGRALNSPIAAKLLGQGAPSRGLAALVRPAPKVLPGARPLLPANLTIAGGTVATPEDIARDEEIVRRFREGR